MTYRAGVVGAGGVAGLGLYGIHDEEEIGERKFAASHAGGYDAAEGIELAAVADPDPETLATFGNAWDVPEAALYGDHEAMLREEELDAVSVCTPTYLHHDHVLDAVELADPGVVWCEKPVAAGVADARAMSAACEENGTELVVNHSLRFTDRLVALRELLADGLIGEVRSVTATFRRELLRNATHVLDTLVYLLDIRPTVVSGVVNGENDAVEALEGDAVDDAGGGGFLVTEDGTFVTIDCTVAREISSMSFQLVGTEGKLYLNNDDGEWRYWRLEDGEHVEEPIPGLDGSWSWDTDYRDSFANAAAHLVELLDGDAGNHSTGAEATRSLEVIVGLYVAHHTGSQVSLPLARPLREVTVTSW